MLPDHQQEAQWALDEEWPLFLGIRGERTEGILNIEGQNSSLLLPWPHKVCSCCDAGALSMCTALSQVLQKS